MYTHVNRQDGQSKENWKISWGSIQRRRRLSFGQNCFLLSNKNIHDNILFALQNTQSQIIFLWGLFLFFGESLTNLFVHTRFSEQVSTLSFFYTLNVLKS